MNRRMHTVEDEAYGRLVSFSTVLTGDIEKARDLAGEALVRTLARRRLREDDLDREARAAASALFVRRFWRSRLSRRTAKRLAREAEAQQHRHEPELSAPHAEPLREAAPPLDPFRSALLSLSAFERACAALKYFDDLTRSEVAARLRLPSGRVGRALDSADATLRERLDAEPDAEHIEIVVSQRAAG